MQETMSRLKPEAAYFGPEASGQLSSSSICRTLRAALDLRTALQDLPRHHPALSGDEPGGLAEGPPAVVVVLSVATKLGSHCEWRTLDDVRMFQGAWLAVSEAYVRSEEDLGREQPVARGSAREHSAELEGVHLDAWPA